MICHIPFPTDCEHHFLTLPRIVYVDDMPKHVLFTFHHTQDDGLWKNNIFHNKFKDNVSIKGNNRIMLTRSVNQTLVHIMHRMQNN